MHKIQDLFDSSKNLNRRIESVVTFDAQSELNLSSEIKEYVVTQKLHDNYEKVFRDLQDAFNESSNEVGIWVSGFYGSGKSSFAKYLGLSFDKSLMIDGVTFGERLMSRIQDTALAAQHKTIIAQHNPQVVMIDLSTSAMAGKIVTVSDIVYYETLKLLKITQSTDQKVMCFINLLHAEGKYDDFCQLVKEEKHKNWDDVESNDAIANLFIASLAPKILPAYFPDSRSYNEIKLNSAVNEKERFRSLYQLVKKKTGKDKIIFVLDEVGQYVASNVDLILNVQGMLQIFKDEFKGKVWVIATAQQTLTEDNHNAQLNSTELFRLNDRFPVKVDIEANDIKEIITKRLLGKSKEGKEYLVLLFDKNEGQIKLGTHLSLQERSIYNQVLTSDSFANLYPFLPVHIDILLSLLQKLASRTGGVGLRSVIRLIRDILVENHLADATIGAMAGPEYFYDALHSDMEKNATKEIVLAADKAIRVYNGNTLAVRICKTIAIMQILDDFNLSFDNLCALLYNQVGENVDKVEVRSILDEITQYEGLTLQEIDGKFQFMTNAILSIREERNKIVPRESEKAEVLQRILTDIFSPAPSVSIYTNKTITAGVELCERNRIYQIHAGQTLKINISFTDGAAFTESHRVLLTESTRQENNHTLYWLCTLSKDKEVLIQDIVRCETIRKQHQNETNKEILAYLRAQNDMIQEKTRELSQLIHVAMDNSEIIFRGSPVQVTEDNYKIVALKDFSEKIFEKYPLASANMKGDCVTKLASFTDTTTIPSALNPLAIIKKDGSIDTSHPALMEMKDFISMRNEPTGSEMTKHFEEDPYGWSKDTLRYMVALMLKASMIKLRVGGDTIKVFGEKAKLALAGNNSFSKISLILNTEEVLSPKELIEASKNLIGLFNVGRPAPIAEQIAKKAYEAIRPFTNRINSLKISFEALHLAGLSLLNQAMNYTQRILDTEGGDAPYLLAKDQKCVEALKYVMDILHCDQSSSVLGCLKHISHLIGEARKLADLPLISMFMKHVDEVEQLYNDFIQNPALYDIVSEITDLKNQLDNYVKEACVEFQTEGTSTLNKCIESIQSSSEFSKLNEDQLLQINTSLNKVAIDSSAYSIDGLRELMNDFTKYTIPGGYFDSIKCQILEFVKENDTASNDVSQENIYTEEDHDEKESQDVHEVETDEEPLVPISHPKPLKIKSKLTSRKDVEELIAELQEYLADFDENAPIELEF